MPNLPLPAGGLLPHKPPMLCIDTLLAASDVAAEAQAYLAPGHILLHGGVMSEAGFAELAAQTAGALKGYGEIVKGLPARDGFLAAIQDFSILALAKQGDTLRIVIRETAEIGGVSLIEAVIARWTDGVEEAVLARGKLKVFVIKDAVREVGHG